MQLIDAVQLPPVRITHAPLRLPVGARWCAKCGYELTGNEGELAADGRDIRGKADHCPRCRSKRLVPAVDCLQPGEYEMIQ